LDAGSAENVSLRRLAAMTRLLAAGLPALLLLACAGRAPAPKAPTSPALPVGEVSLETLLAASPDWRDAGGEPEAAVVERLAAAPGGWSLETVYGHWCTDSSREIPRLLRILELLGRKAPPVVWVAVDPDKREPADIVGRLRIEWVPTIVVRRDGREVGRIVERSSPSLEENLLAIVDPAAALSSCGLSLWRRGRRGRAAGSAPTPAWGRW
jgi:hypothetical protein